MWVQNVSGFILFEDVRGYAMSRLDPALDSSAQTAAIKAIDDAVYGLMMVLDATRRFLIDEFGDPSTDGLRLGIGESDNRSQTLPGLT